eukprot:gene9229-biopygen2900
MIAKSHQQVAWASGAHRPESLGRSNVVNGASGSGGKAGGKDGAGGTVRRNNGAGGKDGAGGIDLAAKRGGMAAKLAAKMALAAQFGGRA